MQKGQYVSRGVLNDSSRFFQHICVVPSYHWDTAPRREIFPFRDDFPDGMSIDDFTWLLDRLTTTQGLEKITFSGGEPARWGGIDKALFATRQKGITTSLMTAATSRPAKSLPDSVYVNLHTYLDQQDWRDRILANIQHYQDQHVPVRLVWYPRQEEVHDAAQMLDVLSKQTGLGIHKSPAFSEQDLVCTNCPYARPTIQPDADTVTLCKFLSLSAKMSDYLSLSDMYEQAFLPQLADIRPACKEATQADGR